MKSSVLFARILLFLVVAKTQVVFANEHHHLYCRTAFFSVKTDSLKRRINENPSSVKICACQVLQLGSLNNKAKNYVLFAERTNRKSFLYDSNKARWVLEKEKRHLTDFFYDKMEVLDDFVENTDCRSLYSRMKKKHSKLILYDILDADLKR
jgi:hypothetical protein